MIGQFIYFRHTANIDILNRSLSCVSFLVLVLFNFTTTNIIFFIIIINYIIISVDFHISQYNRYQLIKVTIDIIISVNFQTSQYS